MTSLADTLWQEFAVESEEHLQAVEPLLARGDLEQTSATDVAQLFRSFHSLKGLARAMDVLGMESVAHHAENLLGLIREGRATLTLDLADLLLLSVDALKQMRGRIIADRVDTQPDPTLLTRLGGAYTDLGGADAEATSSKPVMEAAPAAPGDVPLHEDPDMLEIFVEMLRMRGPDLCAALSSRDDDRETAIDAAETLAHAAEVMTFEALAESFSGVLECLRAAPAGELDSATRQNLVSRFGDIRLQIELFGEITGQDAGAAEFAAALAASVGQDHAELIAAFDSALEHLRTGLDEEGWVAAEVDAAPVVRLTRQLHAALSARSLTRLPQLLLLVEDLYSRATAGELFRTCCSTRPRRCSRGSLSRRQTTVPKSNPSNLQRNCVLRLPIKSPTKATAGWSRGFMSRRSWCRCCRARTSRCLNRGSPRGWYPTPCLSISRGIWPPPSG
jgi:two-component system chemotaxis sensor kinase CheA